MKFTLPLTIFAIAAAVDAAAVDASQEDKRWCLIRGQSCWKAKRAADAFSEAIKTSGGLTARDESSSEAAFMAKRQVDSLALAIAAGQGDPTAYYEALGLGDEFAAAEKPTAEKREASPNPWCLIRGQSCWKAKREAEASNEASQEDKRWCLIRGQSCWKAKRAAEAVVSAIEAAGEHDPRDLPFNPEARVKRDPNPWCLIRGQSCWKRDASAEASCNAPGGACTVANRDLHAVYNIARSIVDAHSE